MALALPSKQDNDPSGRQLFMVTVEFKLLQTLTATSLTFKRKVEYFFVRCWTQEQAEGMARRIVHMQYFMLLAGIEKAVAQKEAVQ